jgi:hypothetical protein
VVALSSGMSSGGVALTRLHILRFSTVAGILALLLAGCGGHPAAHRAGASSSSTGVLAAPATEGTGPESPLAAGSGGVAISVPSLPVGDGGSQPADDGQHVCVTVAWLGTLHSPATLTVTAVVVVNGPFRPAEAAAAGCTEDDGPPCAGLRVSAADNGGHTTCAAGVTWTGGRAVDRGSVELAGELTCQDLSLASCQQVRDGLQDQARARGPDGFDFPVPPAGTSSPPPPSTSSPAPASTTPSPAPGTSSPQPGA